MRRILILCGIAVLAPATLLLAGTALGAVGGAAIGGLASHSVGGAVVGGVAGGFAGNAIARSNDCNRHERYYRRHHERESYRIDRHGHRHYYNR